MDLNLTGEQKAFQEMAKQFAARHFTPIVNEYEEKEECPIHLFKEMAGSGLLGAGIPEVVGGMGLDAVSLMLITKELAKAWPAGALGLFIVPNSLVAYPLAKYGTPEQIEKYLKPSINGEKFGCFGLTEPDFGSHASGIKSRTKFVDDKRWPYYRLSGEKTFITNITFADFILVLARSRPAREGEKEHDGLTTFIVDIDKTCTIREIKKIGLHSAPFGSIHFNDTIVTDENVLGDEREGYKIFMDTLTSGRLFIAAQAWGIAEAAYEESLNYAKIRKTFGKLLIDHQSPSHTLVDMGMKVDNMARQIIAAARLKDSGGDFRVAVSAAKIQSTEDAVWICDRSLQMHGAIGYTRESRVGRRLIDARALPIYEGANEIQKDIIAKELRK